jgi:hypothetical protein
MASTKAKRTQRVRKARSARALFGTSSADVVPSRATLAQLSEELRKLPQVQGWYVGYKKKKGRSLPELSLCVLVPEKRPVRSLSAAERIPKHFTFCPTSKTRRRIRSDVISLGGSFVRATVFAGAGDGVVGPPPGTIGMALSHPQYGPVVTTAGHVFTSGTGVETFEPGQRPVVLRNAGGEACELHGDLLKVVVTDRADYALIRPHDAAACQNVFQDQVVLGRPYSPSPEDIASAPVLYVLTAAGAVATRLQGVDAEITVGPQGIIRNVILTTRCTQGGDSGACLVDSAKRVWGTLVGFNTEYSVFLRANVPLYFENAEYL